MSVSLPQPAGPSEFWSRFSADPRTSGLTRASDADRDLAAQAINQAFTEGRLDVAEHSDRLERALAAKRLDALVPLVSDLLPARPSFSGTPLAATGAAAPAHPAGKSSMTVRAWLALAVLFNVIWAFTVFSAGHFIYYWPMWPMLGTAIPLLIAWIFGWTGPDADGARRASREARRDARGVRRASRRGLPPGSGRPTGDGVEWPRDPRSELR